MATTKRIKRTGTFLEDLQGKKTRGVSATVLQILEQLGDYDVADQNNIVSEVLKRIKFNRQRSFDENQSKAAGLQQDLVSFDQAVSTGLNTPYESPSDEPQ